MDVITEKKRKRTAKSVVSAPVTKEEQRLKRFKKHKAPWYLAPDGKTILCAYSPDDEPLVEV